MDRYLTLEAVRLTEMAALHASRFMGRGDEDITYFSASEAMVNLLNTMNVDVDIVIGSDSQESKLMDGTVFGPGNGAKIDVAVKPLDGKMTCARGGHNAISIIAVGNPGSFMRTPSGHMMKIAVGPDAKGKIDIDQTPEINIKRVARAKGKYIEDMTVCVLDREVNSNMVEEIRQTGARIKFIRDGDISGAISAAITDNPIDLLIGVGGAKEGVLAAAALKCLGGDMQARYIHDDRRQSRGNADDSHIDYEKIYSISDLVRGSEIMVAATGVTDGVLLAGVRYFSGGAETSSIVMRQKTHTVRHINAVHHFDFKPIF
ncbi:MAG: fructose-bisphosphatase class II [Spirochaetae bacterium HGW-Spirochaetae-1]|jgi:fructose-1,6-bisphosphatase II|nr:MAG: fructose-bisphosphatase class II [Spirochaetae bacterium HGW-Spirochaetae-1]